MLRVATVEDVPVLLEMGMKFAKATPYKDFVEEDKVKASIENTLKLPVTEGIIIMYGNEGMLAAVKNPMLLGSTEVATELAWWVAPEAREKGVGDMLVDAFELWAKQAGAKITSLSFVNINLSKYMKTKGYELYESTHLKVL